MNLLKNQEKLNKIFKENQVLLAYLFGSAARGKITSLSDIDIAVLFLEKVRRDDYFSKRLKLASEIDKALGVYKTEIVCLNEAPPLLKHRAVFYGILIFVSDSKLKRNFELRVLEEYEDFNYYLERSYGVMKKHLKEGTFGKASLSPKKEKSFVKYKC
jgi:predicted nucleotidyltransferase